MILSPRCYMYMIKTHQYYIISKAHRTYDIEDDTIQKGNHAAITQMFFIHNKFT